MANTTSKQTSAAKTTSTRAKTTKATETTPESPAPAKKPVPTKVDPNKMVTVINGFHGILVYVSNHTGERYTWDAFGDEQEMELSELKRAKASAKDFYIKNWFMFNPEDSWIIDYLGVGQYYKNAVPIDSFDDIFQLDADELEAAITDLPEGQKESAAYRARQLIESGQIDSNRSISTLERLFGMNLVQH